MVAITHRTDVTSGSELNVKFDDQWIIWILYSWIESLWQHNHKSNMLPASNCRPLNLLVSSYATTWGGTYKLSRYPSIRCVSARNSMLRVVLPLITSSKSHLISYSTRIWRMGIGAESNVSNYTQFSVTHAFIVCFGLRWRPNTVTSSSWEDSTPDLLFGNVADIWIYHMLFATTNHN